MRKRDGIIGAGFACVVGSVICHGTATAQVPVEAHYQVYAAGLHIADVDTDYALGPSGYQIHLTYHTTGITHFFAPGENDSFVTGAWRGEAARPQHYLVKGSWKGDPRGADIDFGVPLPIVHRLVPDDRSERQPIPDALRAGSVDTLSAIAGLMRLSTDTGRCDMAVRTYDGHRVLRFEARRIGTETLGPYRDARFTGQTLRCDFTATPIAGMKIGEEPDGRPFTGSVWLAPLVPGSPPMPARMAFGTRWFGDAIMYLINARRAPDMVMAGAH